MTPEQIKSAREQLGLSTSQLAAMLDTDKQTVHRMELPTSASTHRAPAHRMVRLIEAYLAGYRPADWPLETDRTRKSDNPSLLVMIAAISAVGGKVEVMPDDMIHAPRKLLRTTGNPQTGGVLIEVVNRERKRA